MVTAWAAQNRMALANTQAPGNNEAAGALQLIELIQLKGFVVTADALHCHRAMAKAIIDRGAERAEMGEILRQRHAPDHLRDAVQHMAHGRFKEGLAKLAPNILEVGKDGDNAAVAQKVVEAYLDQRQARDTQIVVATNAMRGLVSVQLREHLKSAGELGAKEHDVARLYEKKLTRAEHLDARSYALGDKVPDTAAAAFVGYELSISKTFIDPAIIEKYLGTPRILDELSLAAADAGVEQVREEGEQRREEQELQVLQDDAEALDADEHHEQAEHRRRLEPRQRQQKA